MTNVVTPHDQDEPIGILGGGQLSQMLVLAAVGLHRDVQVWAESGDSPAAQVGAQVTVGDYRDHSALREFLGKVRIVAFENEFVDCDLLERASEGLEVAFHPTLDTIRVWQDKLSQKKLLESCHIPTSPFSILEALPADLAGMDAWLEGVVKRFGTAVLKWARYGYDGKGVKVLGRKDLGDTSADGARAFCLKGLGMGARVYAEAHVPFVRELAMVATAGGPGQIVTYPLVISEQRKGICYRVEGPAEALGVPAALAERAKGYVHALALTTGITGTFALEMFELPDGELWVNELAPRVHNTGHYTQDASTTSQFENHLRALWGMSLGATDSAPAFAMLNLLGPPGVFLSLQRDVEGAKPAFLPPDCRWHWYDKKEIRPGRKLGHVNGILTDPSELPRLRASLEKLELQWIDSL